MKIWLRELPQPLVTNTVYLELVDIGRALKSKKVCFFFKKKNCFFFLIIYFRKLAGAPPPTSTSMLIKATLEMLPKDHLQVVSFRK